MPCCCPSQGSQPASAWRCCSAQGAGTRAGHSRGPKPTWRHMELTGGPRATGQVKAGLLRARGQPGTAHCRVRLGPALGLPPSPATAPHLRLNGSQLRPRARDAQSWGGRPGAALQPRTPQEPRARANPNQHTGHVLTDALVTAGHGANLPQQPQVRPASILPRGRRRHRPCLAGGYPTPVGTAVVKGAPLTLAGTATGPEPGKHASPSGADTAFCQWTRAGLPSPALSSLPACPLSPAPA